MNRAKREQLKKEALEQFKKGKSVFRKGGAFAPLLQNVINAALEEEMSHYLTKRKRSEGNKRNGKKNKRLKTSDGALMIQTLKEAKK